MFVIWVSTSSSHLFRNKQTCVIWFRYQSEIRKWWLYIDIVNRDAQHLILEVFFGVVVSLFSARSHANATAVFVGQDFFVDGRRGGGVLHRDDRFLGAVAQCVRIVALGATPRTRVASQDGTLAATESVAQNVILVERRGFVVVLAENAVLLKMCNILL